MINPGDFNEKIKILALNRTDSTYQWSDEASIWAKVEQLNDNRAFPHRRSGAKSVKFTIRKCALSLNSAILWKGSHCFLTDIAELDRMYYEVAAIMLEPKTCTVSKLMMSLDSLNRPAATLQSRITFPGLLTEVYSKKIQGKPMALVEVRYILTVPKVIELQPGEILEIEDMICEVWAPRRISDYRNEYEVRVRRDA